MAISTAAPVKNAMVRSIRNDGKLKAALIGGIHQRPAPRATEYPMAVYTKVSAPWIVDGSNIAGGQHVTLDALFDFAVISLNPVEAENLDQLLANLFGSPYADVRLQQFMASGLNVLRCQRIADLPGDGPGLDAEGKRIFEVGGTYRVVVDQINVETAPA